MSASSTTIHHHSLWSRFGNSPQGVAKRSPLRVMRLIADLTNHIDQQPPSAVRENEQNAVTDPARKKAIELFVDFCMLRADKQNREEYE
jgi:hypothetical protein